VEKVEQKSLFAVHPSTAAEVPVDKVESRAHKKGQSPPPGFQDQHSLIRIAEKRRPNRPGRRALTALVLLGGEKGGVPRVFLNPENDVVFLAVIFDDVVPEDSGSSGDIEMMIHQIGSVEQNLLAAKDLEQPLGICLRVT
jgi:hypothetical protein